MKARYLLDTNIISAPFRRDPPAGLLDMMTRHAGECAICTPVWHELRFGLQLLPPSRRRDALERYLSQVVLPNYAVLEYTRPAAEWHASQRARLRLIGREPPLRDAQIAAIAAVDGRVLVTHNVGDFAGFEGVRVEDWLA